MTEGLDGADSTGSSEPHVADEHAAWRTGRLSKSRYYGRTPDDQQDDPGWIEGILRERALVGLFDDPEESEGSRAD
jgi:hypothetical protein